MDEVIYDHGHAVMELHIGSAATLALLACGLVFLLEMAVPTSLPYLALSGQWFFSRPWTLVTHIFAHGSLSHLLMNAFGIFLFGFILERQIGPRRFAALFLASGMLGGLSQMASSPTGVSLGASGALFGVLGMLAVLRPKMVVYVDFIPVPMILAAAGWFAGEWLLIGAADSVGHAAHLGGLALGLLGGGWWRLFRIRTGAQLLQTGPLKTG